MVVEGFEKKWLKSTAETKGRTPDAKFASLKLIEECLLGLGFEPGDASAIVAPLKEVHELRTKMKGHASGDEATVIKKKLLKEHGTFKAHFSALCKRCDESIRAISTAFGLTPEDRLRDREVQPRHNAAARHGREGSAWDRRCPE